MACRKAIVRGRNLGFDVRFVFEWVHEASIVEVIDSNAVIEVPCELGAGEARLQIFRTEDGSESEPVTVQIAKPKVEEESQK